VAAGLLMAAQKANDFAFDRVRLLPATQEQEQEQDLMLGAVLATEEETACGCGAAP